MCHWLWTFPHILYVLLLWRYQLILLIILLSKYYITFSCNVLFLHCGSLVPLFPPPLKKCIYLYFLEEWWRRWLCFFVSSFSCQSSWMTGGAYSFWPLAWRRSVLAQQVKTESEDDLCPKIKKKMLLRWILSLTERPLHWGNLQQRSLIWL